ncbi:MAG: hypothetical protein B5M53_05545 [Candidatus Cloacimonas sp. 4484_209]|nr:MAG: hypothetical protein B5M53_05545 [Candidatus Cloacimonas sp. 4484_209]
MNEIFNQAFTQLLVAGAAIIVPVVELLKRLFNLKGIAAVILSLLLCLIIGIPYGLANHLQGFVLVIYAGTLFAIANGWYKVVKKNK